MDKNEEGFGDFVELDEKGNEVPQTDPEAPARVRMPRGKEVIGIIKQRLGGNRMEVAGTDGKTRNCRVPGRFKRTLWLRPKDVVLIQPWIDDNDKGDVIFKYNPGAVNQLRKRGILNTINTDF